MLTAFPAVHFSTARSKTVLLETDSFSSYDCRPRASYPQQFCFQQFRCQHWKEHEELLKLRHSHGISAASARSQSGLGARCVSFRLREVRQNHTSLWSDVSDAPCDGTGGSLMQKAWFG